MEVPGQIASSRVEICSWFANPAGYFSGLNSGVEIRLRQKDSKCFITIKSGLGKIRLEEEIGISSRSFEKLWPLVRAKSIRKTRHRIPYAGLTIELDVYRQPHRGLMIAEVEFSSAHKSESFAPPAWLGREVTGKRRYANESLARSGHPAGA